VCDTQELRAPLLDSQGLGQRSNDIHGRNAETAPIIDEGQSGTDAHPVHSLIISNTESGQARLDTQGRRAALPQLNESGHAWAVTHPERAALSENDGGGQLDDDAHLVIAPAVSQSPGEEGHSGRDTQQADALLSSLKHHYRLRVDYHNAEKRLTLQAKAILRRLCDGDKDVANALYKVILKGGDHSLRDTQAFRVSPLVALAVVEPLLTARDGLEANRKEQEKKVAKLAKQLPHWDWIETVIGVGPLSYGQLIAETGDLTNYDNPAKVWKRLGLAVIHGERQRRVKDADLALEHGYSPARRSMMWNIGQCLMKAGGEYRQVYLDRMTFEHGKALAEGLIPATTTKATIESWENRGLPALTKVSKIDKTCRGAGHMHNRSTRYMEKRFIKHLWRIWNPAKEDTWNTQS